MAELSSGGGRERGRAAAGGGCWSREQPRIPGSASSPGEFGKLPGILAGKGSGATSLKSLRERSLS